MADRAKPVVPISYLSTDISEPGKWGFAKPQSIESTASCQASCPAGIDIPRFLYFLQNCRFDRALSTILKENPLPGVCGRVCYHPCETGCNRAQFDESISIHYLERFVADAAAKKAQTVQPLPNKHPMKVAVVGAGPAGLSCAYFLSLLGHEVAIFEAREKAGGVLRWGIPEYRLPKAILKRELRRIFSLPIELKTRARIGKDIAFEDLSEFDALFLSPGAGIGSPLSIKGETLERILKGGEFLERINSNRTVRLGKDVIVVGGGNTAMDVARTARRLGARATVAYRRTRNEMPAFSDEIAEAEEEGVRFSFLIQPAKIELTRKKRLAVTFQRMKLRAADRNNRPKAVPVKGDFVTIEADSLITAAGESVDLSWLPRKFVKNGLIEPSFTPKIFAGGDAVAQPRSIAAAIASGKKAAISIDLFHLGEDIEALENIRRGDDALSMEAYLQWRREGTWPEAKRKLSYERIKTLFFRESRRLEIRKLKRERRLKGFLEVNLGYSLKKAVASAMRCFACGICNYCENCNLFCPEGVISIDPDRQMRIVDYNHCKGCGTCVRACPRSALEMKDPS
jgi:NADPH-dependent glutamate synthase beta subunit-like oxidoreductase/Pyruvate/2-oxoacid:ferredoxin oxidoreductase delta subunit